MGIKGYLILMSITTLVAWSGWFLVITRIDPQVAGAMGFALFYFSLFLSLLGTFSILGYLIRLLFQRHRRGHSYKVSTAFRQAALWSLALITALALQGQRILSWWMLVMLVVAFSMVELTFIALQKQRQQEN